MFGWHYTLPRLYKPRDTMCQQAGPWGGISHPLLIISSLHSGNQDSHLTVHMFWPLLSPEFCQNNTSLLSSSPVVRQNNFIALQISFPWKSCKILWRTVLNRKQKTSCFDIARIKQVIRAHYIQILFIPQNSRSKHYPKFTDEETRIKEQWGTKCFICL